MRKFRKVAVPAHVDYTVTLVRPNGERWEHYTPYVYPTRAAAQVECDRINGRHTPSRYGRAEVQAYERPASIGYSLTIPFPFHR